MAKPKSLDAKIDALASGMAALTGTVTKLADKFDALTGTVENGFAALAEDIAGIKERMATKDDVRSIVHDEVPGIIEEFVPPIVAREVAPMRHQLKDIEARLDTLDEHYRNVRGFSKEIDGLRAEISAIKKHLGITDKIAA